MTKLLLIFILIPAVELWLLIEVGRRIGALPTLGLIVLTGLLGASLARWQGLAVLAEIRREMDKGRIPAASLLDGLMILIAAAVLLTPGLLTDLAGFLCLIPFTRRLIRNRLVRWVKERIQEGSLQVSFFGGQRRPAPHDDAIDITPESSSYVEPKTIPKRNPAE